MTTHFTLMRRSEPKFNNESYAKAYCGLNWLMLVHTFINICSFNTNQCFHIRCRLNCPGYMTQIRASLLIYYFMGIPKTPDINFKYNLDCSKASKLVWHVSLHCLLSISQ